MKIATENSAAIFFGTIVYVIITIVYSFSHNARVFCTIFRFLRIALGAVAQGHRVYLL